MQSGIDNARNRIDAFSSETPTKIDVRPQAQSADSGISFRDVLDAINPLNHIPIVSDIFENATDHQPSTLSKLVGGTLFGGPVGFVASLAGVIYKGETGQSAAQSVYAALTSDPVAPAQVASAEPISDKSDQTELSQATEAGQTAALSSEAQKAIASLDAQTQAALGNTIPGTMDEQDQKPSAAASSHGKSLKASPVSARAVLDLYGASPTSAHASYRHAQLRSYLKDVNVSQVL